MSVEEEQSPNVYYVVEVYEPPGMVESEVLYPPKAYIPRSLLQLAPLQPLRGTSRASQANAVATYFLGGNGNGSSYSLGGGGGTMSIPLKEKEILTFHPRNRLRFLYALPGHGTTSMMISEIVELRQSERSRGRWMSYMDLRKVYQQLNVQGLDRTWTLAKMIIAYNNVTKPDMIAEIQGFFQADCSNDKENIIKVEKKVMGGVDYNPDRQQGLSVNSAAEEGVILAELFLDELDEVPPQGQEVILQILKKVDWKCCGTRVWVSSRPHLKPKIEKTIKEDGIWVTSFELVPFSREEQISLWVEIWKLTFINQPLIWDKLKLLAGDLHTHMEQHITDFSRTLGTCPSHLQTLAEYFSETVVKYVTDPSNTGLKAPLFDFSSVKLLELLVKKRFDAHLDQWIVELPLNSRPKSEEEIGKMKEKEFRRLQKLHVRFAISTYGANYSSSSKFTLHTRATQERHEYTVYRLGLMYEMNGWMEFLHPKYAEFILAQYFVDLGRTKSTSGYQLTFFLDNVLFEHKCKSIRKYFNDYWGLQQERNKIQKGAIWMKLRLFLCEHYRLQAEVKKEGQGYSNDGVTSSTPPTPYSALDFSHEDIKTFGSVVHLALIEGNLSIYELIVNSFRCFPDELIKLLSMTAQLEIYNDNPFTLKNECLPETHTVSVIHLLALFGRGEQMMDRVVGKYFRIFGRSHEHQLQKYFGGGEWTPLHYAGMSSNNDFLHGLFLPRIKNGFRVKEVNVRNPKGQQPPHLVLASRCWYYSLRILDPPHTHKPLVQGHNPALLSSGSEPSSPTSNSILIPLLLSAKKPKGVKRKAREEVHQYQFDLDQFRKSCKEIWAFEGTTKDFNEAWEHHFYPSRGQCGYLLPHLSVLERLFQNGGSVNGLQEEDGKGLLHLAASYPSSNLTRFLLEKGADPKLIDKAKRRPAHYAEINGNGEVLAQLLAGETKKEIPPKKKKKVANRVVKKKNVTKKKVNGKINRKKVVKSKSVNSTL